MKTVTRQEAVDAMREKLVSLTDDENCVCDVASRMNIFCGGWSQWSSADLRKRFDWIVERRPRITRRKLEDLANRWQLARQFVKDEELACDVQSTEDFHPICGGWTRFTDEELAGHYRELLGEDVAIQNAG